GRDGGEGVDLDDRGGGFLAEREVAGEEFLQRELEGRHAAIGADEVVEHGEKRRELGRWHGAEGGEGELDERKFVLGAQRAEVQGIESAESIDTEARGNEVA